MPVIQDTNLAAHYHEAGGILALQDLDLAVYLLEAPLSHDLRVEVAITRDPVRVHSHHRGVVVVRLFATTLVRRPGVLSKSETHRTPLAHPGRGQGTTTVIEYSTQYTSSNGHFENEGGIQQKVQLYSVGNGEVLETRVAAQYQ